MPSTLAMDLCPRGAALRRAWRLCMAGAALLPLAMAATAGWSQMEGMDRSMAMGTAPRPVANGPTVPTDTCIGGILPAGDPANPHDLLIKGMTCRVDGTKTVAGAKDNGIYVYRNVNIVNGGTLVFSDAAIDFHAHSILVERAGTLSAGADSPIKNKLTIYLWGGPNSKTQTWSTTDLNPSVTCKGDADPSKSTCGIPTDVWNSNPGMAMRKMPTPGTPCTLASTKAAKDPFNPTKNFALPVDDCFYQYDVIDAGSEAGAYFGRKVLAVSEGGNLLLRGAKGIRDTTVDNCPTEDIPSGGGFIEKCPADSGTSWVRLASTLQKGALTFNVDRAVPTWGANDEIVVTTTDFLPGHSEKLVISSVKPNPDGTIQITVKTAVQFPHVGAPYDYKAAKGSCPGGVTVNPNSCSAGPDVDPEIANLTDIPAATKLTSTQVETRAVVALLTRNIMIASEGSSPVLGRSATHFPIVKGNTASYYGGHVIVRQGVQTFKVQGVEFYQLGQGGLIGRYPVHFHMDRQVPRPSCTSKKNGQKYDVTCSSTGTYLADSSIVDSMTRFVTVHATQGVTLARNVGYMSIGQGYYLEDATETDNRLYSNVAITMRAGIADAVTNPRTVPGILEWDKKLVFDEANKVFRTDPMNLGEQMPDDFPKHSDVNNPSAFWIQNAWNDIEYNAAVGCQTCGSCYWFPPAGISGPSVYETWTGYASIQGGGESDGHWGTAPFYNFRGNSCSAAMFALQTVGSTVQCNRIQYGGDSTSEGTAFGAVVNKNTPKDESSFPYEVGQRNHATICSDTSGDCTKTSVCLPTDGEEGTCAATVVDRFTTSFNWAPKNFSAVWMRGWWQLMQNSAITDQFKGGLTFVSGGGFTRSDAAQGFWSVLKNSVLVGQTQKQFQDPTTGADYPVNPAASVAGPFNLKTALDKTAAGVGVCDQANGGQACVSYSSGINILNESFGDYEHLFNIYDGPAAQYNNIYADVKITRIGRDTRSATFGQNGSTCVNASDLSSSNCTGFGFQATRNNGNVVRRNTAANPNDPKDPNSLIDECFIPNSAIAWKQPNGFYYPPAFHSDNLIFSNVDIRHYVIQPLFKDYALNYFQTSVSACNSGSPADQSKCKQQSVPYNYCSWASNMFAGSFSDIDRETELTDDDGSLTGLTGQDISEPPTKRPSISVTKAAFNDAPVTTDECASGQLSFSSTPVAPIANGTGYATVNTSPYEYMSLAVFRGSTASKNDENSASGFGKWSSDCGNSTCYGVPLYRQYLTAAEKTDFDNNPRDTATGRAHRPSIRMMGGGTGARSALVMNHGSYYIDSSVSAKAELDSSAPDNNVSKLNVFEPSESYTFFLLFANNRTYQTYSIYVGKKDGFDLAQAKDIVKPVLVDIADASYKVSQGENWAQVTGYDKNTGILTLTVDLTGRTEFLPEKREPYCQPTTFCEWKSDNSCGCKPGTNCTDDKVCSYGIGDVDCPTDGCFGFQVKMPDFFPDLRQTAVNPPGPVAPPTPVLFTKATDPKDLKYFQKANVALVSSDESVAGNCNYPTPPQQTDIGFEPTPRPTPIRVWQVPNQ
jgi:G8 domain